MGQFSVEICHLVGQFSMKLNSQPAGAPDRSQRNIVQRPVGTTPQGMKDVSAGVRKVQYCH